jgi:hypothetical protein
MVSSALWSLSLNWTENIKTEKKIFFITFLLLVAPSSPPMLHIYDEVEQKNVMNLSLIAFFVCSRDDIIAISYRCIEHDFELFTMKGVIISR